MLGSSECVQKIEGRNLETLQPISISLQDGKVTEVEQINRQDEETLPWIAPGLVDLQINGFQGLDFNTLPITEELISKAVRGLWKEGVTTFYPTVITNGSDEIEEMMRIFSKACKEDYLVNQSIAGIHLEGPFISPEDGPRGAHGKEYVMKPDWALFQRWQRAAEGRIKILTLSPEWTDAITFIRKCKNEGVTVSIGHTAATPYQIQEAVKAGARMSTHFGNGAHLMLPRHPNYLWEQLAQDDLWTGFIADGFHLPDCVIKVILKTKQEKAVMVSDAVYLSGLEPGEYETHIGGKVVLSKEGKLHLAENSNLLAGSAKLLTWGIEQLVQKELCSLSKAWEMASSRPALCMNLPITKIEVGESPDFVVFDWIDQKIQVKETYKKGVLVYSFGSF